MKIETKTNGYEAKTIQAMIKNFETAAARLFPECLIRHFYYGDYLDMADIILESGHYAHFNIAEKRVSLCGYSCSDEELKKFQRMTYKDECYKGRLLELAK
ncbi:MAG: hypothetical protein IKH57_23450 [Clostridia bacterium]|nr:hypothetical protein [Clostridia bacterium]